MMEAQIENDVCQWARSRRILPLKLAIEGRRGFPDRTFLLPNGKVVFIEFKTTRGRVAAHQYMWLEMLQVAGHVAVVCDSVEAAIGVLNANV